MRVGQTRKRDWNEREIIAALRQIGVVVLPVSGAGVPDLICWHPHEGLRLLEVKTPRGTLTEAQRQINRLLPVSIVRSVAEALAVFGVTVN